MTLGRSSLPIEIQKLIIAFSSLPGIGPKTAQRLTFYVLSQSADETLKLSDALSEAPNKRVLKIISLVINFILFFYF